MPPTAAPYIGYQQPKEELPEAPKEGLNTKATEAFSLDYTDKEVEDLVKKWTKTYSEYFGPIKDRVDNNLTYLHGDQLSQFTKWKQNIPFDEYPPLYNLLYECIEILAPLATKAIPQVSVTFNDENDEMSKMIAKEISEIVDNDSFRAKLENALRDRFPWFIGVLKVYYDSYQKKICIDKLNPQDILIDPNSSVVDGLCDGEFIGHYVTIPIVDAKKKFADKIALVEKYVDNKNKYKFTYIEWWADNYVFQTVNGHLLDKFKNPYWNYDKKEIVVDEFGAEQEQKVPQNNHLKAPPKPFIFININNDGTRPHDVTTELEQAIPVQHAFDQVMYQINKNASRCNGYAVISGFDKNKAKDIADAAWNGGVIVKPSKTAEFEIKSGTPLPAFMYEHKNSLEVAIRNLFGVLGSSPQGSSSDSTVRGKILMQGQDGERVTTYTKRLELTCTNLFNLVLQLLYVTQPQLIPVVGFQVKAKEGSMIPKDSLTQRNEAVDLWAAGAITPEQLYQRLDIADPKSEAVKLLLFKLNPSLLLPPEMQAMVAPPSEPPKVSTSFKDLTPVEQDQVLEKQGIQPDTSEERPKDEPKSESLLSKVKTKPE